MVSTRSGLRLTLVALLVACSICSGIVRAQAYRVAVVTPKKAVTTKAVRASLTKLVDREIREVRADLATARSGAQQVLNQLRAGDTSMLGLERTRMADSSITLTQAADSARMALREFADLDKGVLSRRKLHPAVSVFCERLAAIVSYMIHETVTPDIGMPIDPPAGYPATHTLTVRALKIDTTAGHYRCMVSMRIVQGRTLLCDTTVTGSDTTIHEALECVSGTPECAINACVAALMNPTYIAITGRKDAFRKE